MRHGNPGQAPIVATNAERASIAYEKGHPEPRNVLLQDISARDRMSFSLIAKMSIANSYSRDRFVFETVGLSVHRATFTPASKNFGSG